MASSPEERRSTQKLVQKVLGNPALFPDELLSWLPRWLQNNVNFQLAQTQLPPVESVKLVGASGNAVFQNGWVNWGGTNESAHYYKDPFGRVFIGGIVKSGTVGVPIFTLPPGYRPQEVKLFTVTSNSVYGQCVVSPDGTVLPNVGSSVSFILSGINFRAFA